MEKVVELRRRMRGEALRKAEAFTSCVKRKLGKVTTILFGGYARGASTFGAI